MGMLRAFIWVLAVVCFGYNFYQWGGLKVTPHIGTALMKDAPMDTPLAATYLVVGEKVIGTIGQTDEARDYVGRKFPELIAHPEQLEYLAVGKFKAAQGPWADLCYWLGPFLVVLNLVLHWTRQKKIKSLGSQ